MNKYEAIRKPFQYYISSFNSTRDSRPKNNNVIPFHSYFSKIYF